MTASQCPHGFDQRMCEICRVLDPGSSTPPEGDRSSRLPSRVPGKGRIGLGIGVVAVIAILVVVSQVIAAVWSVLHLLQLVAVAALAGWIGWKAGVFHGRRGRS